MTQDSGSFFVVDVDGAELRFDTPEMFGEWIAAEQDFWAWTRSVSDKRYGMPDDAISRWREKLSEANSHFTTVTNSSLPDDQRNQAFSRLPQLVRDYATENFGSGSPRAQFVQQIRESNGDAIALAAMNHALGGVNKATDSFTRKQVRRAASLIDSFDASLEMNLPAAVSASVKKMVASYQSAMGAQTAKNNAALKSLAETQEKIEAAFEGSKDSAERHMSEHSTKLQQDADAAIERIEATRKAYQEQMHLGASVDYWNTKAAAHERNSGNLKKKVIWFAVIAGGLLAIVLCLLGSVGIAVALHKDASPTAPLLFLGIGVVVTTGVMWAGRVLVRLFLSEHHLGIDARERATMAQTFLALTNEGKIEPSERALVLAPLFRPTTDGIVKDDGAPDATIAGHLSRITGR